MVASAPQRRPAARQHVSSPERRGRCAAQRCRCRCAVCAQLHERLQQWTREQPREHTAPSAAGTPVRVAIAGRRCPPWTPGQKQRRAFGRSTLPSSRRAPTGALHEEATRRRSGGDQEAMLRQSPSIHQRCTHRSGSGSTGARGGGGTATRAVDTTTRAVQGNSTGVFVLASRSTRWQSGDDWKATRRRL